MTRAFNIFEGAAEIQADVIARRLVELAARPATYWPLRQPRACVRLGDTPMACRLSDTGRAGGGDTGFAGRFAQHVANGSASTSQKLMRWRVGLQFATVTLVMIGYYLSGR